MTTIIELRAGVMSGSTGPPEGVELTHENAIAQVHATDAPHV